jgi:hypothetical protein
MHNWDKVEDSMPTPGAHPEILHHTGADADGLPEGPHSPADRQPQMLKASPCEPKWVLSPFAMSAVP